MVWSGQSVLEPWEFGLDYSIITKSVSDSAWPSGRHWIGIGHSFIKFPSVVQNVQFSANGNGNKTLRSRTADGLEVALELSFQYQLSVDQLFDLYMMYGANFHDVFVRMAMDLLTVAATKHQARAFFDNRTSIGADMEASLRKKFKEHAFCDVPLFQFQSVTLPKEFEGAIKQTQVAEQQIKRVYAEQHARVVEFETLVIQAQRNLQIRLQQANGAVESIRLENDAYISAFNATQMKTSDAFAEVLDAFGGDTDSLLEYMKVRALRDHASDKTMIGIADNVDSKGVGSAGRLTL